MSWALPAMILACLAAGVWRRVPVYDAFLEGAKEGLATARSILPALSAMLCAVRGFEASGLTEDLCRLCAEALGEEASAPSGEILRYLPGEGELAKRYHALWSRNRLAVNTL